MYDLMKR